VPFTPAISITIAASVPLTLSSPPHSPKRASVHYEAAMRGAVWHPAEVLYSPNLVEGVFSEVGFLGRSVQV
jgi:hypothetical protein